MLLTFPFIFPPAEQRFSDLHSMTIAEKMTFSAWAFSVFFIFFTVLNLVGHAAHAMAKIGKSQS